MYRRMYHVSCVAFSFKKVGVKLNKLLNPKNKRSWHPTTNLTDTLPSAKSLTKVEREPGKRGIRRMAMLNKVFMKQITDIMSTGTVSLDIIGHGIEISNVKVAQDMKTVSVFWVSKGDTRDEKINSALNKIAGLLRHELSTLRVMGEVPYITFVKDYKESRLVELDQRLSIADYGEDYTRTEIGHLLKSEFTLDTKLSPEIKAKIKQLEDESLVTEEPLPEMTHCVYGLDHAKIMNRLLAARKKSKDAWNNLNSGLPVISYRTSKEVQPEIDIGKQRQQLTDFLLKRQVLQKKLQKELLDSQKHLQATEEDENDYDDSETCEEFDDEFYDDYYEDEKQHQGDRNTQI